MNILVIILFIIFLFYFSNPRTRYKIEQNSTIVVIFLIIIVVLSKISDNSIYPIIIIIILGFIYYHYTHTNTTLFKKFKKFDFNNLTEMFSDFIEEFDGDGDSNKLLVVDDTDEQDPYINADTKITEGNKAQEVKEVDGERIVTDTANDSIYDDAGLDIALDVENMQLQSDNISNITSSQFHASDKKDGVIIVNDNRVDSDTNPTNLDKLFETLDRQFVNIKDQLEDINT